MRELLQGAKPAQQEDLYRAAPHLLLDDSPDGHQRLSVLEVSSLKVTHLSKCT